MSLGTKIFSLFFILLALIVYTVASFDYSKLQGSTVQTTNTNEKLIDFDTKVIVNYIEEIKNKALEIKDELLKDTVSDNQIEKTSNEEIALEEQKAQEKLISDTNMVDEVEPQDNQINTEIETTEEIQNIDEKTQDELEENPQSQIEEKQPVQEEIVLSPKQIQEQINAILKENKIIFKRRSVDITKDSFSSVQKVADILKEHENIKVEIAGHTDSRGRASLNLRISQDRANSVKNELVKLGVKEESLKAVGYGEKYPIVKDDKNGLSEINRRVEINIIGEN